MKHQAQRLLFCISLTLCLLSGIEAKLASGQENTGDQRRSDQNTPPQQSSGRPDRLVALRKFPAAMYGVGWVRKDSYAQGTALLAGDWHNGAIDLGYDPTPFLNSRPTGQRYVRVPWRRGCNVVRPKLSPLSQLHNPAPTGVFSDTEAFTGYLRKARELTRQSVDSATRAGVTPISTIPMATRSASTGPERTV
jgi:hypothetical protein